MKYMPMRLRSYLTCLAATLAVAAASAATATDFDVSWFTLDSGGTSMSAGSGFELSATIAQSDAGAMSGAGWELAGGFWVTPEICNLPADLNGDGTTDALDIQGFVDCIMGVDEVCACAQLDSQPGQGEEDVAVFVDLLIGPID